MSWKVAGNSLDTPVVRVTVEPRSLTMEQAVRAQEIQRLHDLSRRHILGRELPVYALRFRFIGPALERTQRLDFVRDLMRGNFSWSLEAPPSPNGVYFNDGAKSIVLGLAQLAIVYEDAVDSIALDVTAVELAPDDSGTPAGDPNNLGTQFCLVINGQSFEIGEEVAIADGLAVGDDVPHSDDVVMAEGTVVQQNVPVSQQLVLQVGAGMQTMATGTQGSSMDFTSRLAVAQGGAASQDGFTPQPLLPTGAQDSDDDVEPAGDVDVDLGGQDDGDELQTAALQMPQGGDASDDGLQQFAASVPAGGQGAAHQASGEIVATAYATNVVQTNNGGAHDWTMPSQAQGQFQGSEASIVAGAILPDDYNADLKAIAFALGQAPAGWTRSKVELLIRHRWDLDVGLLSSASAVVTVRDGADAVLATPINRTTGTQATLLTETFDITSAVAALTEAQLQAIRVWCQADCNLFAVTGGNASWNVDGIHIRVTYTKTGIV